MDRDTPFPAQPAILSEPQFSQADVLPAAGLTAGQLKGILDRKQVRLMTEHNPGSGRRRMFTGADILKIATANAVATIGFPLRFVYLLADQVERRAFGLLTGTALEPCNELSLAFYPIKDGKDHAVVPVYDGKPASPLPVAVQILAADRLIRETVAKLNAIVNERPVPSFDVPEIEWQDPYGPEENFFRAWDKDAEGRTVRTGLTFDETQELEAFNRAFVEGRRDRDRAKRVRYLELQQKHEAARLKRLGEEAAKE